MATITYEETLRQAGFGLVTVRPDNLEQTVSIQAMTRYGHDYVVEQSTNLTDWAEAQAPVDPRGTLLTYVDDTVGPAKMFYRVLETNVISTSLEPFLSLNVQGVFFSAGPFNRANFVTDMIFTTPSVIDANTDMLLVEIGGGSRGTAVGLIDGKLAISAGETTGSIVAYTGASPLAPSTSYSLRITAMCEGAAGADSFVASLWTEGNPSATLIVQQSALTVAGFSGTDDCGLGLVNNQYFTAGVAVPSASPPPLTIQSFQAYDPDAATVETPLPPQPEP